MSMYLIWFLVSKLIQKNNQSRATRVGALLLLNKQGVSSFYRTQLANSEDFDFHVWSSPGFLMQQKIALMDPFSLLRTIKFIIGLDFAVTLSSLASSCVLFDITSRQLVELKWLILNNFTSVSMSESFFWCQCF